MQDWALWCVPHVETPAYGVSAVDTHSSACLRLRVMSATAGGLVRQAPRIRTAWKQPSVTNSTANLTLFRVALVLLCHPAGQAVLGAAVVGSAARSGRHSQAPGQRTDPAGGERLWKACSQSLQSTSDGSAVCLFGAGAMLVDVVIQRSKPLLL